MASFNQILQGTRTSLIQVCKDQAIYKLPIGQNAGCEDGNHNFPTTLW